MCTNKTNKKPLGMAGFQGIDELPKQEFKVLDVNNLANITLTDERVRELVENKYDWKPVVRMDEQNQKEGEIIKIRTVEEETEFLTNMSLMRYLGLKVIDDIHDNKGKDRLIQDCYVCKQPGAVQDAKESFKQDKNVWLCQHHAEQILWSGEEIDS